MVDPNKMKPTRNAVKGEVSGWKCTVNRKRMKNKIEKCIIARSPPSWTYNMLQLRKYIEILEENIFASAKDEKEYVANLSARIDTIMTENPQSAESNPLHSNTSGSEREANVEYQEQLYQQIQTMRITHVRKIYSLYKGICRFLQQHESVPPQPETAQIQKLKCHKRLLQTAFVIFTMKKSKITPDLKQKVEKLEKYIHNVCNAPIVSSHHQMQNSAEVHSVQQLIPPHSRNSHADTLQSTSPQSYQVANQFSSLQQQANEASIIKGRGNDLQEQINGEKESPKPFIITTPGISASPLLEECCNVNETCQNTAVLPDDTSAAMQGLIKLLSSISDEALMASSGEIGAVVCLNDCISTLEPLNVSVNSAIDKYLEGVNDTDLRTRYLTCNDYVQRGREISRIINSTPTSESFFHFTSQENYTLLEEIKKINNRLIDTEVVIDEEKTIPSASGGVDEHGVRGILVKLVFNSISVNVNLMSQYDSSSKKSIIKPLWILVPSSYPLCSPVILDEMPSKISKDLDDLSMKAKFKLRRSLQSLNQPMSLRDIATSWDHCAREAICEYAKLHGGGTFSSKYGGWETCHDGG